MSTPVSSNPSSYSDLLKQVRSHEVALAEINNLSSSRVTFHALCKFTSRAAVPKNKIMSWLYRENNRIAAVYQKNGNIFFRTTIQKATASEQTQLDTAKARLQKLGSA